MEKHEKFLAEELFFVKLCLCNVLKSEDVADKQCLVICAMGGIGLWRKSFGASIPGTARRDGGYDG